MSGERILVVEDERITARDIQATLEGLGYQVPALAASAAEALARVEELTPELVLMDIRLAGETDGISAADEIRRRFEIPVVYLTAYADPETLERATRTEAYGYLLKPFSEQELHTTIQLALYKSRAERALKESEERFRKLVANASDMITVLDASGRITYKGPSVRRVLGYRPEEVIGKTLLEVVHPDDHAATLEVLRECLEQPGDCRPTEYRMLHKNGEWRVLEARGTNRISDPAIRGVVINSRDITERKEMEQALRQAKEQAEAANRAKSAFLSRTSHELRTPMNAILGFAQVLELELQEPEDRECIAQVLRAGRHLLRLIDELLEIATAESGRLTLAAEPVDVHESVQRALATVEPLLRRWPVQIVRDTLPSCQHTVLGDALRLEQVLVSLLSNAIKFNRAGGTVAIACRPSGADHLRVEIRDTGPGIAAEVLERLFLPFERAGAERTATEGPGLGLALARALVTAMGGRLGAESTPGAGSTFWFELPLPAD